MRYVIDPGRDRRVVKFTDSIVYSHRADLEGNMVELELSVMRQKKRKVRRSASEAGGQAASPEERVPVLLWIPGGGYRGIDKNLMAAELEYLAEAGYAVALMYYRSSAQAHYPEQLKDVKTAIRFLRSHAEEYGLDPEHIGVMGSSGGGHLAAMAAMNADGYDTEEWPGVSSQVQAVCDMFGPVDIERQLAYDDRMIVHNPEGVWDRLEDTHAGALLGGEGDQLWERAKEACVHRFLTGKMAPILILHGDADRIVPLEASERFYKQICEAGMEERAEFYVLRHAGHGSAEFFQPETRKIVRAFFDKYLKDGQL